MRQQWVVVLVLGACGTVTSSVDEGIADQASQDAPSLDLALADQSAPDLAVPPDVAVPADLAASPDLVALPDLVAVPDLKPKPVFKLGGPIPWGAGMGGDRNAASGQFTNDTNMDVVGVGGGQLILYRGNGTGGFTVSQVGAISAQSYHVAAGEFSGDTNTDVLVSEYNLGAAAMFLGGGNGTFARTGSYPLGSVPALYRLGVGDFDGDGDLDIAGGNGQASGLTVHVLRNDGAGAFGSVKGYANPRQPTNLLAAEIDGVNGLDLVAADVDNSGLVTVFLNDGAGNFNAGIEIAVGTPNDQVAVGDFNGDGRGDLVVGCNGSGMVANVLLGNGNGTFQAAKSYVVQLGWGAPSIADLDGDGHLDVVMVNLGAGSMSVLLGKGDGTFQPASNFAAGMAPHRAVIADFNNDGKPDLAIPNSSYLTTTQPNLLVFLNETM